MGLEAEKQGSLLFFSTSHLLSIFAVISHVQSRILLIVHHSDEYKYTASCLCSICFFSCVLA